MPKVTLDPGHNSVSNVSPTNKSYIEGVRMWKLGCYLNDALQNYGIDVVLTRPKVTDDPELDERGKLAATTKSDLFISLHSNAPGKRADGTYDTTVTGTEVYYSLTDPDNKALADKLGAAISAKMKHKFRGSRVKQYSEGHPDWDWYGVIRSAARNGCKAAFLIEHGFHTCPKDINFLMSDSSLAALAEAEAKAIAEYFGTNAKQKLYRVQIGAFKTSKNAEKCKVEAAKHGYAAFITKSGKYYRVQVGAFESYERAEARMVKLKVDGFKAFVVETTE